MRFIIYSLPLLLAVGICDDRAAADAKADPVGQTNLAETDLQENPTEIDKANKNLGQMKQDIQQKMDDRPEKIQEAVDTKESP